MKVVCLITAQENLASSSRGVQCQASVNENRCTAAIDGKYRTSNPALKWTFAGNPVGQWIQLNFPSELTYSFIRIMENVFATEKNIKDIELSFDDEPRQLVSVK